MNENLVRRLATYKLALARMEKLGLTRVFSENIADATANTAALVRKDFAQFHIHGKKRGGYNLNELIRTINTILGRDTPQKMILAGAGRLGTALLDYPDFQKDGLRLLAAFDINPQRSRDAGETAVPVYPLEKMDEFISQNSIRLGIIATPGHAAQDILNRMVDAGIRGILNFAPASLRSPEGVFVNSINLEPELETVIYFSSASMGPSANAANEGGST